MIPVNHLEGHALSVRITEKVDFPFLLLLVSGGHCALIAVEGVGRYRIIGETLDDALGEAFDKTAKMLGLPYPGGPEIEKRALAGDENRFNFPKPLLGRRGCDFSFSGLKTAVRLVVQDLHAGAQNTNDVAASFQRTVAEILHDRVGKGIEIFQKDFPKSRNLVVAGGVAANNYLKNALQKTVDMYGMKLSAPPMKLCTDNAAMIAWAGIERMQAGLLLENPLGFEPRARWPLGE